MRIAIMQPTYLPWTGLFNLLANVDTFVFLDNVQFERRSWQQRQRIILNGREFMLTVPVRSKGRLKQSISDVQIDYSRSWADRHLQTLLHAYGKHPYGGEVLDLVGPCLRSKPRLLVENNIAIIAALSGALGLTPRLLRSSTLSLSGRRSELLMNICRHLGADVYLSAAGSRGYIETEGMFAASDVKVGYQDYLPKPYPQLGVSEFVPYMSIVDVIANLGCEAAREHVMPTAVDKCESEVSLV
ncbi:MAG: WbqC family protein [bacterium]